MVIKSRFLKQGHKSPSSSYDYDSLSFNRSHRAFSAAPSAGLRTSTRASSIAPMRASSIAPMRASSIAPMRASSIAPMRASSVAPRRASSIAPMRASSVAPMRASSIAPRRASSIAPMRASSLAPTSSSFKPMRSSLAELHHRLDNRASSVSPYSPFYDSSGVLGSQAREFRAFSLTPSARSSGIDTTLPSHKFGTRLGVHKVEKSVKPAIYDEYYGTTYVPSSGRDSWSAYRISDEALDDNDNLVYESAKKDYELMKRINRHLLNTTAPPQNPPTSVPVVRTKPKSAELTNKTVPAKTHHSISVHPVKRTVNVETPDLDTHAAIKNLKKRLLNVYDSLSMSKASSMNNRDSDMLAIRKEVEAIKAARANREKNLGLLSNQLQAHQREPYSFNKQSTTFSKNSSRL